jgi:hypothetical protein
MSFEVGQRVTIQTRRRAFGPTLVSQRRGTVTEVVQGGPRPRYRIRWDDERESVYAGSELRSERVAQRN